MADKMKMPAMVRPNWRRMRADAFLARVYLAIEPLIESQEERRAVYHKLRELFIEDGVEIITDEARREAGLPPRDEHGMSPHELVAIEQKRLELLMRPPMFIVGDDMLRTQKKPAPE